MEGYQFENAALKLAYEENTRNKLELVIQNALYYSNLLQLQ